MLSILRKKLDRIIDMVVEMPFILKVVSCMSLLVIPIPFAYIFTPSLYTNTEFASLFFKEWFLGNNILFSLHIIGALPTILLGPFLLYDPFRKKRPHLHRTLGKIYVVGCLISAVLVIPLALNNGGNLEPRIGFTVMAVLWFFITYFGYTAAINKDYIAHRRWMMRSYAMSFAFVHVNLTYKLLLPYEAMSFTAVKVMQSMVSWMFNLMFVEIFLCVRSFKNRAEPRSVIIKNFTTYNKHDRFYWKPTRPASKDKPS